VWDATIVSNTSPCWLGKGTDAALHARVLEKKRLYAAQVEANGEEFVVAGATAFGAISPDLRKLLSRAASFSDGLVSTHDLVSQLSQSVALTSGAVIAAAERRIGIVSRVAAIVSGCTQIPSTTSTGRVHSGADEDVAV
jgi:hypothetical protein